MYDSPPAATNSKVASVRSPPGTKKPSQVVQQKPTTMEVDDVVEEISMESIDDEIEVEIDVSG